MAGEGYPMVATHDPRLVDDRRGAGAPATTAGRGRYEYQMLYGIRPDEQRRLAAAGEKVRVYVPYGHEWYGYLMRRLAERPGNLAFFLRSLVSKNSLTASDGPEPGSPCPSRQSPSSAPG